MSGRPGGVIDRAAALRAAFDRSFAQAPSPEGAATEKLLAIRLGAHPYVLRLSEVSGLFADKKITRLPSPVPDLLGIAGFRGTVLPVYDLGLLLGGASTAAPRWLVVAAGAPVGLAFDGVDGYLSVACDAIVSQARVETREPHVREVARSGDLARPLISLASVAQWVRDRAAGGADRDKER
jgi:purine-binding chemotaxis protein CheW